MSISHEYSFIFFCFHSIILINSIGTFTSSWPRFYHSGESTHPTQSILNNLTHYQQRWQSIQEQDDFDQTYTFTMSWDCAQCHDCLLANKFIHIDHDVIDSLETSALNDNSKIAACSDVNRTQEIGAYKTIDDLYQMLIDWVSDGLDNGEYLIIELMLHRDYYFPIAVKLSQLDGYMAWNIICFEPGYIDSEDEVCQFTTGSNENEQKWTFWITQEMQSFLGWSMIFLILVACSLGYCINWLKKKKSEKIEAWREKEERQREERERQKDSKTKGPKKKKRKSSKAKHKKQRHNRDKSDHEYSKVQHDDDQDDNRERAHYDVQEEQITPN